MQADKKASTTENVLNKVFTAQCNTRLRLPGDAGSGGFKQAAPERPVVVTETEGVGVA
jgi:hypothetical protein